MGRCRVGTEIQTLIFAKSLFTRDQAIEWADRHGFSRLKIDETDNSYRLRQWAPSRYSKKSMRTIALGESGVKAVIGCPK